MQGTFAKIDEMMVIGRTRIAAFRAAICKLRLNFDVKEQMMKRPIVAANWKMNVLPSEACHLAEQIRHSTTGLGVEIVLAPPYTHLALLSHLRSPQFSLGAQNVHNANSGAYTSGISVAMLKDLQVEYVIVGHSERREAFPSEKDLISDKIRAILEGGLKVIYCCGENRIVRESGKELDFVASQLAYDFRAVKLWEPDNVVIAYEPIWAIGTGLTASPEQAGTMHTAIRLWLKSHFGHENAEGTRIIYGGSVKGSNASDLAAIDGIDGALVGGASLSASEFSQIARAFRTHPQ